MKYRLLLLTALVSTALTVSAQKAPVNFNGTIVDAFTRQAIKGEVTCSLLRPDSTVVMTTKSYEHTDRGNGTVRTFFKFDVPWQPDGHFLVKLEAKGYETVYKTTKLVWKSKPIEVSLWNVPMRRTSRSGNRTHCCLLWMCRHGHRTCLRLYSRDYRVYQAYKY